MCGSIWTFFSVPLIYLSIISPKPHCFDYCAFTVSLEVGQHQCSNFILLFQYYVGYSEFLSVLFLVHRMSGTLSTLSGLCINYNGEGSDVSKGDTTGLGREELLGISKNCSTAVHLMLQFHLQSKSPSIKFSAVITQSRKKCIFAKTSSVSIKGCEIGKL